MKRLLRLALVVFAGFGVVTLLGAVLVAFATNSPNIRLPAFGSSPGIDRKAELSEGQPDALRSVAPAPAGPAAPGALGPAGAPAARTAAQTQAVSAQQAAQVSPVDFGQRLIVRSGNLSLLVNDVSDVTVQARNLAESLSGFVVSAVQHEESGKLLATVTIRVPADRFELAMEKLKGMAVRVSSEQVSSRDVTEEFVDTEARLRNFKATEARYLDLLQQARTVDDVLKVEQQLTNVRGQIEQLQGRLQFLQRSGETSTITIELRPFAPAQPPDPTDWSLLPVIRAAWAALLYSVRLMLSGMIWLAVFAPIWLPIGYVLMRWRRRALPAVELRGTVAAGHTSLI